MKNVFLDMNDEKLYNALLERDLWQKNGYIADESILAEIRNRYYESIGANGMVIMDIHLLYACSLRWMNMIKNRMTE